MKIGNFLLVGLGVAGVAGGVYLYKLNKFSGNLEVVTIGRIQKVGLTEIVIRLIVKFKNPTGTSVQIKFPFVRLLDANGNLIGSSKVINKDVTITKYSEVTIDPIDFQLNTISLASKVPAILNAYRTTGKLQFYAEVSTVVDKRIPVVKREEIIIGGSNQQ